MITHAQKLYGDRLRGIDLRAYDVFLRRLLDATGNHRLHDKMWHQLGAQTIAAIDRAEEDRALGFTYNYRKSRFAMKNEAKGYVTNCHLIPRDGETLFTIDKYGRIIPTLDGYRIEPIEVAPPPTGEATTP